MSDELEITSGSEPAATSHDDDDAAYSERVRKRIGVEVGKRRSAENVAADAQTQLAIERNARIAAEQRLAEIGMEQARQASREAFADGDAEKQAAASEAVVTAAQRVAAAQALQQVSVPQTVTFTPATRAWMDENPWYDSDPAAKAVANRADGEARERGLVPDSDAYWGFIEARVSKKFPHHFAGEHEPEQEPASRNDLPAAAPARRVVTTPSGRTGGRLPSLTAQQVAAAEMQGMTVQEYAAEVQRLRAEGAIS